MNKNEIRLERNRRAERMANLKAVFLFNEKKQVFTDEEIESIKKEFLEQFRIKDSLKQFPKHTVSKDLETKIKEVLTQIETVK